MCYWNGQGCDPSKEKALESIRKAAGHGHADAQYSLGNYYYSNAASIQDLETAANWYQKSADQGLANAQCALADCYYLGKGRTQNYYEAFNLYKRAADQGLAYAQNKLGDSYYNGTGCDKNNTEAFAWYTKAADKGIVEAKYGLGNIFYEAQLYNDAVKWYSEAADQGLASAQCALGDCYYYGRGGRKSYTWAAICYEAAAQQSNQYESTRLRMMYSDGFYNDNGTSYRNKDLATEMLIEAAYLGYPEGQYRLALIFADAQMIDAEIRWLEQAASQGHAEAQRVLNRMQR
jgi:TPR repeat protein